MDHSKGTHRVVSNFMVMASAQAVTWIVSILHLALVSRYLGPNRLGEFVLASSFTTILGLLLGLGMDTFIVRAIARAPERGNTIATAALVVRGSLATLVPAAIFIYSHAAHLNTETTEAAYILGLAVILQQFSNVLVATFQGNEKMSYGALGNVVFNVAQLGLTCLAIMRNGGVVAFAVNNALLTIVVLALNVRWGRRFIHLTRDITLRDVREVITGSFAFCAGSLFQTFYTSIDSVLLGALAGSQPVAYYGAATRLLTVPMVLPYILGQVTLPWLSRLGVDPGRDFEHVGRKTLSLLITFSVPLAIGLITFAGFGIALIFGPSFQAAVPAMVVLSLCIPFTFVDMQFYQILAAHNQEWRWTLVMGVSCVLNPISNVILIPLSIHQWHDPALGAALSLLLTEGLMAIYGAIVLARVVWHPLVGRAVFGATIGGTVQALLLWLVGSQSVVTLLAGEVGGGVIFLVVAVVAGALPRQDVYFLLRVALRRYRPVSLDPDLVGGPIS
jgi:O-antigen/teichoic acid export membrane protein